MGALTGAEQGNTAIQNSQANSQYEIQAAQEEQEQNALMFQQQAQLSNLVASRTAALTAQLGPNTTNPNALSALPTIATSQLGDQSTPTTSRNSLLGS